jgi:hypothetical protein
MTFKEKRRAKKLAKVYFTLGYIMLIPFIMSFVLLFTGNIRHDTVNPIIAMLFFIIPIFAALILAGIGQGYGMSRADYKNKIRMYREYRHFNIILDYLEAGNVKEARNLFDSLPQGNLRVFVNGMIFGYRMLSTDAETKKFALDKLNGLREDFCHHNVQL